MVQEAVRQVLEPMYEQPHKDGGAAVLF